MLRRALPAHRQSLLVKSDNNTDIVGPESLQNNKKFVFSIGIYSAQRIRTSIRAFSYSSTTPTRHVWKRCATGHRRGYH